MSTTEKWSTLGTETDVISFTSMSALANNALVLSSAYNNVQSGGGGDGYVFARITAILTMATGSSANTGFSVWILKSQDGGTTYERGGTGYTPLRLPDAVFVAPVDTTQTPTSLDIILPAGFIKFLIKNDGTGQATKTDTSSAGSKLSVTPITSQMV